MCAKTADDEEVRIPLTKERVLQAAIMLADESGIASLSMRKIAEKLRVEAMSLYHHVANKDEILDGMVDAIFDEIMLPVVGMDWKIAMRQRAVSTRKVLTRHRWAIGLLDSRNHPGVATIRHHNAVLGCLRESGFSLKMAAHAFSLLDSYVYGFLLQELNLPFQNAAELDTLADRILAQMPADTYPYFTEIIVEHALKPGYSYSKEFEFGLDLILDGLERMRHTA